jgi:hypothetical protein
VKYWRVWLVWPGRRDAGGDVAGLAFENAIFELGKQQLRCL